MRRFLVSVLLSCSSASLAHSDFLPLGDGKVSTSPARGYVFSCFKDFPGGGGAQKVGEWIDRTKGVWSPQAKPFVEGKVSWPNSSITVTLEGGLRVVRANNLPKHPTGEFPIRPGTKAYSYDRNPNKIREQTVLLELPARPKLAARAGCVPMGMVGFALDGVAIFNAFDLQGRDAPAYEIQDKCGGHPERTGQYHYHDWSACMVDKGGSSGKQSDVVGFALDGFPILGLQGPGGKTATNADLDECHGRIGQIVLDGKTVTTYFYQFTREYPYTLGCFRGVVNPKLLERR